MSPAPAAARPRAALTAPRTAPQNIDRQLTAMLMASDRSPIDKWDGRARESQKDEDELGLLGGSRLAERDPNPFP